MCKGRPYYAIPLLYETIPNMPNAVRVRVNQVGDRLEFKKKFNDEYRKTLIVY